MWLPLIGPRLHGWLDDLVTLTYIVGALALGLRGPVLVVALGGAAVHFLLTRLTDYPQGAFPLFSFQQHAYVELSEGLLVLAGALLLGGPPVPTIHRLFLAALGASQLVAFTFSDYRQA